MPWRSACKSSHGPLILDVLSQGNPLGNQAASMPFLRTVQLVAKFFDLLLKMCDRP
jgi:hypothetical protein